MKVTNARAGLPNRHDLRKVVEDDLAPYRKFFAVFFHGGAVRFNDLAVESFSMAFYEITSNAAKLGTLSTEGGCVLVHWQTNPQ